MDHKEVFGRIAAANAWGSKETISGPGSTLEACSPILKKLPVWFARYHIQKIADLGCGDFNWLRRLDFSGLEYDGYDVATLAIARASLHATRNIRFQVADILEISVPKVDLVILKDVLIHLPNSEGISILDKIRKNARYLAATSYPGYRNELRKSLKAGEFAPVDLEVTPFSIGMPLEAVNVPHKSETSAKLFAIWRL